jgi:hypothetical protein
MASNNGWGLCKDCKWFQFEPDAKVADATMGLCIEEELQPFRLQVFGNSGCNCFMHGEVAHAQGVQPRAAHGSADPVDRREEERKGPGDESGPYHVQTTQDGFRYTNCSGSSATSCPALAGQSQSADTPGPTG